MTKKYLLSTGITTDRVDQYIIDLFKLYLSVYPGDIPNYESLGFDFIMNDVKKDELVSEIRNRLGNLVTKIKKQFQGIHMSITDIELINETTLSLVINVNQTRSDVIFVDLYKNK